MPFNLRHRGKGIATYLQTFVLIGVALGGSIIAFREVSAYANSSGGPAIQVWSASITQGAGVVIERLTVSDTGSTEFPYVIVLNPDLAAGASYCYTLASTSGMAEGGTCPSMSTDPTSIRVGANLTSGGTLVVSIILEGSTVSQGTDYPLLVSAPGASVVSEQVVASPG